MSKPFGFLKHVDWRFVPETMNAIVKSGKQHLPTILTVTGVLGLWSAGVWGAVSYQKAKEKINIAMKASLKSGNLDEAPDRLEQIKIIAEYCWRPALLATVSTVGIFHANKLNVSKIAGLTMLWQGAKNEIDAVQNRVDNGENEELKNGDLKKARQKNHEDFYEKNPVKGCSDVYETRNGNTLFVDMFSGAKFHSSIMAVNSAITELNTRLTEDQYVSLEEFYDILDLDYSTRKCGQFAAFRLKSMKDVIHPNQILDWKDYVDPTTGEPRICFIDYIRFLTPSDDFIEGDAY